VKRLLLPVLALSLALAACGGGPSSPTAPSDTSLRVTRIAPAAGTTYGGTAVTISGANFPAGATVTIGGTAATSVVVAGATSITAVTPQHAAGAADVVVSGGARSATLPGAFTFVAPSPSTNAPPVIASLTAQGTHAHEPAQFADLGEKIAVRATVTDAETPAADLTYEWSAPVGAFSGSGGSVSWTAPAAMTTPASVTLSLVVIERYTMTGPDGQPLQQENRVTKSVAVSVHDSAKEVGDMAYTFLVNFSKQVSVETVLKDFRHGCGYNNDGLHYETEDVVNNQLNYDIDAYKVGQPATTVKFGGVCSFRAREADACAQVAVDWTSTRLTDPDKGAVERAYGTDQVTAVYGPQNRWWLCDSDFDGRVVNALTGVVKSGDYFFKKQ
jgi:hypothetical protein